jgi:hypothetical protein
MPAKSLLIKNDKVLDALINYLKVDTIVSMVDIKEHAEKLEVCLYSFLT